MIASLKGRLDSLGDEEAIIDVNGIGFQVFMPTSTITKLDGVGKEARLFTHLHLREDEATIYGFASLDELRLFRILIGISGLGPRLALAMLSTMSIEQLTMSIASANVELLTAIPGIGSKMANRIILELKDKMAVGWISPTLTQVDDENAELLTALNVLGYSAHEASKAIATLPKSSVLSLEEKIKLALQYFASK